MFPFTTSQWQELQRQTLIYKQMMASVPVPPRLLLPSAAAASFPPPPTTINFRFKNGTMDPEPGRCRRTDGKKWRCAMDAEPDQKYCNKHLHRKRPRSRKPVEQLRLQQRKGNRSAGFMPNIKLNTPFQSVESNEKQQRCQNWTKGYSENLSSNRQWEMMHSNTGLKYDTKSDMEQYEELPNLNYTYTSDSWCDFLNPSPSLLEETSIRNDEGLRRRFIDAWSSENTTTTTNPNESSVLTKDKPSLSTLTLTMSNAIEEGTDLQIPMGFGGPLGEVLQSSSNMTSPRNGSSELVNLMCKSHETSPQDSPLVSSPSGVFQKGLVSLSDNSSSSSSPTFDAASRSDFSFKWMNLNK